MCSHLQTEIKLLHGVDVTGSQFLSHPDVVKAADFAARAHAGQMRLTGNPYVMHVIETARIVEGILANSARSFALGERLVTKMMSFCQAKAMIDTSMFQSMLARSSMLYSVSAC